MQKQLIEKGGQLMLITHPTDRYTAINEAELFLKGGGKWVQLRMKEGLDPTIAHEMAALCHANKAILCIDDDVRLALSCGADAVHLGKNDMPIAEAWGIIRAAHRENDFIVGATANTFEDIRHAASQGASYIGLGPFRFTQTKQKLSPVLGLEGYTRILQKCRDSGLTLPVFAIGGITEEDIPSLMKTGIRGIAISGTIVQAEDPTAATQRLLSIIHSNNNQ